MQTYEPRNHDVFGEARRLEMDARMRRAEAIVDSVIELGRLVGRAVSPATRVVRRVSDALARRRETDRIYSELARMSDRDLADIGVSRSDIYAVAAGTYSRADETAGEVVVLQAKAPARDTDATRVAAEYDRAA
ncbi:DUF1127 domain-containing protein [Microbaculum marinum]|uniref:DUF1127 domain-containing protein n=1 Tax=Microbaculum marinum TaxID=1764581 RepID=UPI0036139A2A